MSFQILCGDALTALRTLQENSFDGCLCDPPYGLGFMGKAWDHGVPATETWVEVLRVLKPGAMLLAFGGTRTHHRLMCAIEDAGFEIRDCCMWLYGSGFPKSLDISKAMDKAAGAERRVVGSIITNVGMQGGNFASASRSGPVDITSPATDAARTWEGYGTALKPAWEPIILAMKPCEGTFAENALKWGVAGLAINAGRIETDEQLSFGSRELGDGVKFGKCKPTTPGVQNDQGRWPANVILDEEAAEALDEQNGELTSGNNPAKRSADKHRTVYAGWKGEQCLVRRGTDSGGASRFFYTAKASGSERSANLQGRNAHPTVKPVDLARYLASLILPPKRDGPRRLIVPFSGSGSEILGVMAAGWDEALGIEVSEEYCALARERIEESAPLFLRSGPRDKPAEFMRDLGAQDLIYEDALELGEKASTESTALSDPPTPPVQE